MSSNTVKTEQAVSLVFAAGFATSPDFMKEAAERFEGLFRDAGFRVGASHLFPYGDWSVPRLRQLNEIRKDLADGGFLRPRSVGGDRLAEELTRIAGSEPRGQAVLIGHSAGGVACIQAARRLFESGSRLRIRIVMVGSPKCPIPARAVDPADVLYIYGTNHKGRKADPVTRLGRWGKTPPGIVEGVPIVGGHADYFRSRPPFTDERGRSNLDRISGRIWDWLTWRQESESAGSSFSPDAARLTDE